eukprot:1146781-Pelagomonas_calceolata.AAC.8
MSVSQHRAWHQQAFAHRISQQYILGLAAISASKSASQPAAAQGHGHCSSDANVWGWNALRASGLTPLKLWAGDEQGQQEAIPGAYFVGVSAYGCGVWRLSRKGEEHPVTRHRTLIELPPLVSCPALCEKFHQLCQ